MGETYNKRFASILLACVLALGTGWLSHVLFTDPEPEEQGCALYLVTDASHRNMPGKTNKKTVPHISERLKTADIEAGQKSFSRKCASCHTIEKSGPNRVGPNLYNILGNQIGNSSKYKYSRAMRALGDDEQIWTPERLDLFLVKPSKTIPKNKMGFIGIRRPKERASIILYLKSLSDNAGDQ